MKDKGGDRLATKGGPIGKPQKKRWSRKKMNKNKKNSSAAAKKEDSTKKAANTVVALPSRDKPTNSNWEKMRAELSSGKKKRKARPKEESLKKDDKFSPTAKRENKQETRIVALDCEMVGVGESGSKSALARVVVINYYGNVLVDTHCLPKERVTDYRTRVSGIRPADLKGAPDFEHVQRKVALLLRGKVVVGHALKNDFKALKLKHPKQDVRDTSSYTPLRQTTSEHSNSAQLMNDMWRGFKSSNTSNSNNDDNTAEGSGSGGGGGGEDANTNGAGSSSGINLSERKFKSRALKELAAEHLGLEIQHGEHSPVEDARAALYLYHKHRITWERSLNGQKNTKKTFIKDVVSNKTGTSEDSKRTPPTSSREGGDKNNNDKKKKQHSSKRENGKKSHRGDEDRASAGASEDEGYGIGLISSE